jgi:hypothetical protein
MKNCIKCRIEKIEEDFPWRESGKRRNTCRTCDNAERSARKYHKSDKRKKWLLENNELVKKLKRDWAEKNIDRRRQLDREWRASNAEKMRAFRKKWEEKNPTKSQEHKRRKHRRWRTSPKGNIDARMGCAIWHALKDKKEGRRWEILVGYSTASLMAHLENMFTPGMSWQNMGEWHIDHIIPKSAFNYETSHDIDFKKCWALKNLQPLWAADNYRKSDKMTNHYQPSLAISI